MTDRILTLHKKLLSGEITSEQLTQNYIDAIERVNPEINAYVHKEYDYALKSARAADELIKSGKATLLTGIPFTLKDNICTDGMETTCCSKILQGFRPYYDATAWSKLKERGAVLLGKSNMDEFAMGSTCETSCFGGALNPWDLSKVSGGSSGGGAAAVAADIAAYALGSDTGGSVRQPVSFCGVVGFKPSYGAISRYGLIAYASSLDQIGILTSSVADAAAVFEVVCGKDSKDSTSADLPVCKKALSGEVAGKRIGVIKELFNGANAQVAQAVNSTVCRYARAGAVVEEVSIPALKLALPAYYIIACAEASSNLGRYDGIRYGYRAKSYSNLTDMIVKTRTQGFGKEVKKRIMLGTYALSSGYFDAYYKKACILRSQVEASFSAAFEKFDFLLAPTVPNTAFAAGYSGGNAIETYLSDACTVPVNIAGLPAISLPCGSDSIGMPIGLQIIGAKYSDYKLLDFAYFMQKENIFKGKEFKGGANI